MPSGEHRKGKGLPPWLKRIDSERAREIGSIPNSEKAKKKIRVVRRLTALKKKGLTDEKVQELYNIMIDSDMSTLDHRIVIEKLKGIAMKTDDPKQLDILSKNMALWHKSHHGEKHHVQSENVNINMNFTKEEYLSRRQELSKEYEEADLEREESAE